MKQELEHRTPFVTGLSNPKPLEGFLIKLSENPSKDDTRENEQITVKGKHPLYLPISFVQNKLDEFFFGQWNWDVTGVQVVANELIVWGTLEVFHPVSQVWLRRSGTGGCAIQQKSGSEILDVSSKIKVTLGKDFPHAEAEAIKNAAKKFGKAFGRDLNREFEDSYTPMSDTADMEPHKVRLMKAKGIEAILAILNENVELQQNLAVVDLILGKATTSQDVDNLYKSIPYWQDNADIVTRMSNRKAVLLKDQKQGVYGNARK